MKTVPFIALLVLICTSASAATWRLDTVSMSLSRPAVAGYAWHYQLQESEGIVASSGALNGFSNSSANATGQTGTYTRSAKFRVLFGYRSTTTNVFTPVKWMQAYEQGGPINANNTPQGPWGPNGPTDNNGNPVDADGNPVVPPPLGHEADGKIKNDNDFPIDVRVVTTNEAGQVVNDEIIHLGPGQEVDMEWGGNEPFKVEAFPIYDGVQQPDPIFSTESTPSQTPITTPPSGGATAPPTTPGSAPLTEPPAATRPGTTEGNAEARNQDLKAAIDRGTEQARQNGNSINSKLNIGNGLLEEIKDGIEGVKDAIEAQGPNGGGEGTQPSGPGPSGPGNSGLEEYEDDGSITGKFQAVKEGAGELMQAGQGLIDALGLDGQYSSAPLRWTVNAGTFGSVNLDLEPIGAEWFSAIRTIILFVMSAIFVVKILAVIREALV